MWKMKWVGIVFLIFQFCISTAFDELEDKSGRNPEENSCVEVRAVFINCEPEESVASDAESVRFEREELFKHSVLRDCNKKLAVTVKITSEPTTSSGDEYLPIEHVFEGTNKKRIRLLDPYILRLRRELPLQAYKLRRVDTISGVLLDNEDEPISGKNFKHSKNRIERDLSHLRKEKWTANHKVHLQTFPMTPLALSVQPLESATLSVTSATYQTRSCVDNYKYANILNTTLVKRSKRNEHNIVVEEVSDDKQWDSKNGFYHISDSDRGPMQGIDDDIVERPANIINEKETPEMFVTKTLTNEITKADERSRLKKLIRSKNSNAKENESKSGRNKYSEKHKTSPSSPRSKETKTLTTKRFEDKYEENLESKEKGGESERDYAVYEIGHPELWYTVHVQLFEKLSTPDGKTVWNDLTKGELASVSSTSPEWTGQDLNVRYRPAEWIPRDEFSLPSSSLCLLAPIHGEASSYNENGTKLNGDSDDEGYIVLPEEDVIGLKDEDGNINGRNDTNSDSEYISRSEEQRERYLQGRRRVVVRTSRAILTGKEEKVNIAFHGTNKYLTIPHRRPHHAQIDLEARADENELVRVGASGRIAIAVADSSRKTRTVITLQVGNTGLAAARFRVITRDCGPALSDLINDKNKPVTMAGPVLIPPRHTRTLRLELPMEIPVDVAQCSVSLVNDEEKSVAVREVSVKKGDRCFCVWHCDCVCLTDDPRLLCREMPEARQSAAGLSNRDRTRHARSACYKDVVTLNIFIIFTGVIVALLLLGCIKAILGLVFSCIGMWGLDQMVQFPRKIDHYYEESIRCRQVEYDCQGYPVHPDTKMKTVRMLSRSMEFILNVIFFVSVPCIIICDAIKEMISRCRNQSQNPCCTSTSKNDTKKCFSSQDMQGMAALRWRRRRGGLRRWMTPEAQELSKELWKEGLTPIKCEFMRPLLRDGRHIDSATQREQPDDSCVDSEQDDTDYVLTQMQKSRESLSILKQKSKQ
ncbi:uncharacterized protein LOC118262875 isoform X1 [Spodoptera frugiperda]|uniref:Uncharacterized protein LOC118262875 isoform X1 n=2 Tax=Spodoptera frugiperda TaxID=7108 RepID=A0A9R0EFD9_SPOFR|nr:uncharacterized protein LOC118262875 isoform X1 [Spodoptera frugiperda]